MLKCSYCDKKYEVDSFGVPITNEGNQLKEVPTAPITGAIEKPADPITGMVEKIPAPRIQKMFKCPNCGYSTRITRNKSSSTLSPSHDPLIGFGRESVYPQILNG